MVRYPNRNGGRGGALSWRLADDAPTGYKRRYRFTHAKYGVIDGRDVFVGTENLTRRCHAGVELRSRWAGVAASTCSRMQPGVSAALHALFAQDWRPTIFADLHPYDSADPKYGAPPADFVLPEAKIYDVAESPFVDVVRVERVAEYAVVSAPENALRPDAGIHALLAAAGPPVTRSL
jgi:hypothetical protein